MKLLVTGGAGYIGSVVTAVLREGGHQVTVLDSLVTGHRDAVPDDVEFVQADIADSAAVRGVLEGNGYDGVLHFAALSLVGESVKDPERYFANNTAGSIALVREVVAAGVPRMVFSSTAATYGEPEVVPITEDAPTKPTNPYGASKLAVDELLRFTAAARPLSATSLRYFNVAGAHGDIGERHTTETHLIPNVLAVPGGKRDAVDVFGNDYPTPDGSAVRDYIHVVDLANAHVRALETATDPGHRVFNLGLGRGYSVLEVIETVRSVTGHPVPVRESPRRAGDPATLVASADKADAEMGWRAERNLEQMVADAWRFYQSQA
ncbi:UDP-glucose 4-epimerase GalE [Acidothermaceae bacterium B102]|nr:UDP-glucose 4-epimerase GalE [Acidothermaceae bacterium B102]